MPRHGHHDPAPPACCAGCCGCAPAPAPAAPCYCCYPAPAPPPPSSSASDHLLHAIAAHLLLSSSAPQPAPLPQPQPQYPQPPPPQPQYPQPQPPPAAHHATNPYTPYSYAHHYPYQQIKPHAYAQPPPPPPQQQQAPSPPDHGHLLLHSLLRRVAALESALPRHFPARPPAWRPPHPVPRPRRAARGREEEEDDDDTEEEEEQEIPPSPRPPHRARGGRPPAARELAARTIQAHFRRFLARRSRTLRQLKELAVLRSKAAALRGSLSGRRGCADPAAVSEAAMGVLLRLDAIQGGDPMIREGKRAVSREVTRILEFVDKVLVKEHEQMAMGAALDTDEYDDGCNAAFVANRPAVSKKKVSFSANGQVHELHGEADNGNVVVDEESESSSSAESDEAKGMPGKRSANGKPGLAAPVPVHMESRRIAGERR